MAKIRLLTGALRELGFCSEATNRSVGKKQNYHHDRRRGSSSLEDKLNGAAARWPRVSFLVRVRRRGDIMSIINSMHISL